MRTYTEPSEIKKLEEEILIIEQEKEEAVKSQNFEKAASIRDKVHEKKEKLEREKEKWNSKNSKAVMILKENDIAEVISSWTKIPVKNEITKEEMIEKLKMETRRYAKRQLTWFRKYEDIKWINGLAPLEENIQCIVEEYSAKE